MTPINLHYCGIHRLDNLPAGDNCLAVPVNALTTTRELRCALVTHATWPGEITHAEKRAAVHALLTANADSHPFPDAAPDYPPELYNVKCHPTIDDMWLVIDPEIDLHSSWDTRQQAICAAWDDAHARSDVKTDDIPRFYACYRVDVPVPEGYEVFLHDESWCMEKTQGAGSFGPFDTEIEARIAAWRHKLSEPSISDNYKPRVGEKRGKGWRLITPATCYAELHDGLSDMIEDGRLTEADIPDDYYWLVESLAALGNAPKPFNIVRSDFGGYYFEVEGYGSDDYVSELEAIAAAEAYLARAEFTAGPVERTEGGNWGAEIDHHKPTTEGGTWHARMLVYGHSQANARALRDRVLKALNGEADA